MHLGNHARDHAILTNCTPEEMANQIETCLEQGIGADQAVLEFELMRAPKVVVVKEGNEFAAGLVDTFGSGLGGTNVFRHGDDSGMGPEPVQGCQMCRG